ncbi:orotidine-5'-phosphate decarboxylase [bacterium]|nr:orotidine-5'-phosphate decarboxylase [bacterium]
MSIGKPVSAKDRIILALDVNTIEEAEKLVIELKDYVGYFKVGLQLISATGYEAINMIKSHGCKVFMDTKPIDIPNTVAKTCVNYMKHGADFFDIHLIGGSKMVNTTVKLLKETAKKMELPRPTVVGVTLLSSFGQKTLTEELCVNVNLIDYVTQLTKLALDCELDGVLASASEAKVIRQKYGNDFIIICQAVRPTWSVVNDQIRVVTPTDAIKSGVDYMIVGRPITGAKDPKAAAMLIIDEIDEALLQLEG